MKCQNCNSNGKAAGMEKEATLRLWCPTWIGCEKGPRNLCAECAAIFQPEQNEHAKSGSWHWGEAADAAFNSVDKFLTSPDQRFDNAKGMAMRGSRVGDLTYVVDGQVWLCANYFTMARLGKWPEVKEMFPKLFY